MQMRVFLRMGFAEESGQAFRVGVNLVVPYFYLFQTETIVFCCFVQVVYNPGRRHRGYSHGAEDCPVFGSAARAVLRVGSRMGTEQ